MGNMFGRKQVDYFEMFAKGSSIALEAAKILKSAFADGKINQEELKLIEKIEHDGDNHVHECLEIIDVAFITPIDRSDIIEIIKGLENVTDSISDVANNIYMMHITDCNEYLRGFVDLSVISCERLYDLMVALKQFKKNPNNNINELIIEINRLEGKGDQIYTESMRHLFGFEKDPITIIKNKELYQQLEKILDCCEDVANIVEMIMVAKT